MPERDGFPAGGVSGMSGGGSLATGDTISVVSSGTNSLSSAGVSGEVGTGTSGICASLLSQGSGLERFDLVRPVASGRARTC